jgi:pimeloyl-ACP methyl ester carboxylesterase
MSYPDPPPARVARLGSGRAVEYYAYGDPGGAPVFALHGTPASGAGFVWADHGARARGLRVFAPNRPGIGLTDTRPGGLHTVAQYADELAEFAAALEVERYAVLGYSGGGPYAAAVAAARPAEVIALAIVAGAGNVGEWATIDDYQPADQRMTRLALRAPALARAALYASGASARRFPRPALHSVRRALPASDRAVLDRFTSPSAALAVFTRAVSPGAGGVVDDYAALARPWGVDVGAITVPVRCWHGEGDTTVPARHSEELVARVPGASLVRWETDGHLAIVDRVGEVLDWLADHTERALSQTARNADTRASSH